jgi:hypothetical protein
MNVHKVLIVLGALALLTAACGGAGGVAGPAAPTTSSSKEARPADSAAPSQTAAGTSPSKPGVAPDVVVPPVPEGPKVQRSARVGLEVPHGRFETALNQVIAAVKDAHGYIAGSQAQADGDQVLRSGQVTFQVPADRFDELLVTIQQKGTPQTISISGTDVSQQYVDLQARLRNAEAQRDVMLTLMGQAKSVNDTIQIQNQLGQVTAQIEQLKGQIQYLEHSTAYGTLAVSIREAAAGPRDEWGLQTATWQAAHNVVTALAVVIVLLGTLLPVLVVATVVGLVAWRAWPRLRPGRPTPVGGGSE